MEKFITDGQIFVREQNATQEDRIGAVDTNLYKVLVGGKEKNKKNSTQSLGKLTDGFSFIEKSGYKADPKYKDVYEKTVSLKGSSNKTNKITIQIDTDPNIRYTPSSNSNEKTFSQFINKVERSLPSLDAKIKDSIASELFNDPDGSLPWKYQSEAYNGWSKEKMIKDFKNNLGNATFSINGSGYGYATYNDGGAYYGHLISIETDYKTGKSHRVSIDG